MFFTSRVCVMTALFVVAAASSPGCGPLLLPAGTRLPDDLQWQVEDAWEQAMTPPHALGREDLLRFVVTHLAHVWGVDRFKFRSEKDLSHGRVIMTVDFDRALPGDGDFTLEYQDLTGVTLRLERYAGEEVIEFAKRLTGEINEADGAQ